MKMYSFMLRLYDADMIHTITPDPYHQFASPYVWVGNNPVSGVDPDGGWCTTCLMEFMNSLGTILPEVTVTATREGGRALIGSAANVILRDGYKIWTNQGLSINPSFEAPSFTRNIDYSPSPIRQLDVPSPASSMTGSISDYLPSAEMVEDIAGYASLIPGVQTVAGVAEAGAAFSQGKVLAGGVALLGAVPVLGYVTKVSRIAKMARKTIVIGEGMDRVKTIGRQIGARWYQAWGKNFPINGADGLEKALLRNRRWIESKIKKGYTIIDAGPVNGNSPFYKLEKEILKIHKYPTIKL